MKIAQIAPLTEAVPPRLYGGTERIVSYLTDELVRLGHEVTIFAAGDSHSRARLVPCCPRSLRLDLSVRDPLAYHLAMLEDVRQRAGEFDILHFHLDLLHFPIFRDLAARTVTTLHGRLDSRELQTFYRRYPQFPLVSISNSQRASLSSVRWARTIYHGLPLDLLRCPARSAGDYLAFLGRIAPEKRPDLAIEIARRANMRIKLAAKVDNVDREYFEKRLRPLLDDAQVEFTGEIGDAQKSEFLGNAQALLFPIDWPEPFGLVMIESMACGTPVIAFSRGSVPEVVEDGVTGFLVENVEQAAQAVRDVTFLDRREVRRRFEQRFSVVQMARGYLEIYGSLASTSASQPRVPSGKARAAFTY